MRTTRDSIRQKVARSGAGWDDAMQRWAHHYSALPAAGSACSFNNGEGLGGWLRKSAIGPVPWKQAPFHFRPEPDVPERMSAAQEGNVEKLVEMIDRDVVARLADKDHLGRNLLHVAAANGQIHVVRMLAARCAGWPPEDDITPPSTADDLSEGGIQRKEKRLMIKAESERADAEEARAAEARRKEKTLTDKLLTTETIADVFSDDNMGFIRKSAPMSKYRLKSPAFSRYAVTPAPVTTVGDRGYGSRSAEDMYVPAEAWSTLLNLRDQAGDTPLHLAASEGHAEVVDELLYRGAEVETRNLAGRTALHVACLYGHLHTIFVLCSAGANARCRDREGRRPVDMNPDDDIRKFLWALVSKEVAVRGGPTPFGYGDADAHVLINHNDPRFAAENLDFDPDSYDDGSKRLKSAGKVSRMRTAGPIHTGARLPRIRPLTPLELPRHTKYGLNAEEYPRRGTAKTAKSVAFQLEDDDSEDEHVEEMRMEGRTNIPVHEKTITCSRGASWFNMNARHMISTTAQTLTSRVVTGVQAIQGERANVSLRRKSSALGHFARSQNTGDLSRKAAAPAEMIRFADTHEGPQVAFSPIIDPT